MSTQRERVEALGRTIDSAHGMWGAGDLRDAVDAAIRQPGPWGVPGAIGSLAEDFGWAAGQVDRVQAEVAGVARGGLPASWTGRVGEAAAEAVTAAAHDLTRTVEAHTRAARVLADLCDTLAEAQATHARAGGPLRHAADLLHEITGWGGVPDPLEWDDDKMHEAQAEARYAIGLMLNAAVRAEEAGHRAATELNQLAARAEAARMTGGGLSAADRLVLTDPAALGDRNRILSADDAERAGRFLDRMDPADRDRTTALLAAAASPTERAYLTKALAAGHTADELAAFDGQIHGRTPAWLDYHLRPLRLDSADPRTGVEHRQTVSYLGVKWDQGPDTCVASSTVMARVAADPVYALGLTTGGHPDDQKYDNPKAFADRLRAEQNRVYDGGREWYNHLPLIDPGGMTNSESVDVMNQEVGTPTGADYRNVALDDGNARRDVLVEVEKAVDEGKPVPVSIRGEGQGHQLMIIGHSGDKLQVYNPWGYTTWVGEDDFVHDRMDSALTGPPRMNTAVSVRLPK
ncbi:peptidoglycan-binding protein [Kitasatospora sp. NPDC088134]|uniref:peptidoglycan-binding protein n=1 Tax=Kitasatospora sp. NPDC088134 TaxID=3364071 RepID=UPI0037F77F8E